MTFLNFFSSYSYFYFYQQSYSEMLKNLSQMINIKHDSGKTGKQFERRAMAHALIQLLPVSAQTADPYSNWGSVANKTIYKSQTVPPQYIFKHLVFTLHHTHTHDILLHDPSLFKIQRLNLDLLHYFHTGVLGVQKKNWDTDPDTTSDFLWDQRKQLSVWCSKGLTFLSPQLNVQYNINRHHYAWVPSQLWTEGDLGVHKATQWATRKHTHTHT